MAREQYPRTGHIGEQNRENSLQFSPLAINWIANDAAYGLHAGCLAAYEMLQKFRTIWEIIMVYLSRCAHTNPEVRKTSVQCSIPLSLPRSANSSFGLDIELCYSALSALEDVITILRNQ
ncbi:hypothetical protein OROGR_004594 [Orobanche gracilis]